MTLYSLFKMIPDSTRIIIFDKDKNDVVYDGEVLYCRAGYKEREIAFMRVLDGGLHIDVD